jgi:hypothetical protein
MLDVNPKDIGEHITSTKQVNNGHDERVMKITKYFSQNHGVVCVG